MKLVNSRYIPHILPDYLRKYDRSIWFNKIEEFKSYIKREASPGVPFNLIGNTNGKVLEFMGDDFNNLVLDRIELRLHYFDEIRDMSREQRIEIGICDPIRVFVKDEPHKRSKLSEGRVRLIMSVSLADKMIEMLLHRELHKLEIANWYKIPSKPGIGFTRPMNDMVFEDIISRPNMGYADIGGWDWSCKLWLMEACAEGEIDLCVNPSEDWEKLIRLEPIIESESIYQFSDGLLVYPKFKGIVNSGKYKTSRGNSWMRVFLATMIGADYVVAAGDDTVETMVDDAKQKYLDFGWVLKDYQKVEEGFEFCSRWYQRGKSFPLNADKMLMNLCHTNPRDWVEYDMFMLQFVDQLEDHPEFPELMEILKAICYHPESEGTQ